MKPLLLYVTALVVAIVCFVLYAIISPIVKISYTPLPYDIISTREHQKANTTQDNGTHGAIIQRQRAPSHSVTPPSLHGILHFYTSLLNDRPMTFRCSSCALVSSSGFLIGKGAGKEIDRKHCVIRMNLAPVKGHGRDVGTRTTARVMNFIAAPLANRIPLPDEAIFIWGLYLDDRPGLYRRKVEEMSKRVGRRTTIVYLTLEGERYTSSLFAFETGRSLEKTKSRPSTGWYTLMVAADLCREIHVYGMVPHDYCS
ncbi:alpha-N-acetylgalactosaminide alpha-2,6-sialyltransferase 6-like [Patiria miniata]|uniref:Uncharacterized protein n=1 Tax=Patiria miniata TaxID=46514 RepID=A0A914B1T1_PATMI|nr:alpha-N-acetylgalactosaminide alpha-2,6-sialyltransferase 6-like [Patiria miniata]